MDKLLTFDAKATAQLLNYADLVEALRTAIQEHDAGLIHSPVRIGVPLRENGSVLSMPASADDIAIHKLVSVSPSNAARNMPTIFGTVTVCDGTTGRPELILDGPTLTGRRTAALSMLGVRILHLPIPGSFLIIGTGQQARFHAEAISQLYPAARIYVKGVDSTLEYAFSEKLASEGVDVTPTGGDVPSDVVIVITVTTSKSPVYHEEASQSRLIIGVGAFTPDAAEIGSQIVRASRIFVDDFNATRAEAGDLIQADIDWSSVRTLGSALDTNIPKDRPILLKTVGSGAWDLAACRVARFSLK
jgi:1-piperideine-2-carboxylate/1-pyrroline-2-carboxylate reductase [NAD(P)H]